MTGSGAKKIKRKNKSEVTGRRLAMFFSVCGDRYNVMGEVQTAECVVSGKGSKSEPTSVCGINKRKVDQPSLPGT